MTRRMFQCGKLRLWEPVEDSPVTRLFREEIWRVFAAEPEIQRVLLIFESLEGEAEEAPAVGVEVPAEMPDGARAAMFERLCPQVERLLGPQGFNGLLLVDKMDYFLGSGGRAAFLATARCIYERGPALEERRPP